MEALRAKRRATLVFLAVLLLLAILTALRVSPWAALFPLFLALFVYIDYIKELGRFLEEEGARRLGLAYFPELPSGEVPLAPLLLLRGEPKAHREFRGEVLGLPFRRFEVDSLRGQALRGRGLPLHRGPLRGGASPALPPSPPGPQGLAHLPQGALALPLGPPGAFRGPPRPPRPAPRGPPRPEARDEPSPPPGLPRPLPLPVRRLEGGHEGSWPRGGPGRGTRPALPGLGDLGLHRRERGHPSRPGPTGGAESSSVPSGFRWWAGASTWPFRKGACPRALSSPPKRPSRGGRRGSGGRWGPSRG
jgi:hypothetical protein